MALWLIRQIRRIDEQKEQILIDSLKEAIKEAVSEHRNKENG
jgi:hypothetical protein